jgi:phosphinothricin acetyltransferase
MLLIRDAVPADIPALLAIYAPYVRDTAVTFEYEVPGEAEFAERLRRVQERFPWLVLERDGEALGYASLSPFHPRAAYQWDAETSIYLRPGCGGQGLGTLLLGALEDIALGMGLLSLYACIAVPEADDAHLTGASAAFHRRRGYRLLGTFPRCGYKFGTWYHMVWMEKALAPRPAEPAPPVPYPLWKEKNTGSGRIPPFPVETIPCQAASSEAP